ncbi:MAG: helix-turn-helix transcriptional regulator [Leptolyngbya sp. SIO4C5]|nr:helix-turn-helix transcriptional regulator [Leptolyngbya sp. SIO4C5]
MSLNHARTIVQAEYDDIWEAAWERGECLWQQRGIESRQVIPPQLGRGEIREIELRPGLDLVIETSLFWRSLYLDFRFSFADKLSSSFYLAGSQRMINPGIQREEDREEVAGENCLCYLAGTRCLEYRPAEQPFQHVAIRINFAQLRSFGPAEESPSPLIGALVKGKSAHRFHQSLSSVAAMPAILRQILDCPYSGTTQRLYLEAKALELLALQFHQLTEGPGTEPGLPDLRPGDRDRLHQAKGILRRQFEQPPSLQALARQVGLNDYKLKQGFRQLFGTTVFGYVQICRMEQAQRLLQEHELSVAYVADRVGYASPSQFCHAFKRHVGMPPSQYRRQFGG